MIKLENICKSYDEKTVLDNIMAEFPDDSITCIMGESGAGKTTLVRIIAGLENADRGTVSGAGVVSFDFQEDRLINDISAADNIMLVLDKNDFGGQRPRHCGYFACNERGIFHRRRFGARAWLRCRYGTSEYEKIHRRNAHHYRTRQGHYH